MVDFMYKTIFLETNAVSKLYETLHDGIQLKCILLSKNLQPIVSQHTTYELARCFCDKKNHEKGVELCLFLKTLEPEYTCETEMLIRREIIRLRTGESVDVYIEKNNKKHLFNAIENLTKFVVMNQYVDYIKKREENIKNDATWDRLLISSKTKEKFSQNFESYVTQSLLNRNWIKVVLKRIMSNMNDNEIIKLVNNLKDYPAIQTTLRAHLFMNYQVLVNRNKPGKDKLDDLRHLIDSSYSTIFVTNDEKLTKYAKVIKPNIEILTSEKLVSELP